LDRIGTIRIRGPNLRVSGSPDRPEVKATRRPSGENRMWYSTFVDDIAGTGADKDGAPRAGVSMRQKFQSTKLRTYTIRAGLPGSG
jgi:hypothetical protein